MYPLIFSFSLAKNRLKSLSKKKHTCYHIFRYWIHLCPLVCDADWEYLADPDAHTFQWLLWCDLWYSPTSHSCDQVADLAGVSIAGIYGKASESRKGWKAAMIIFSLFTYKYYIHPIGSSLHSSYNHLLKITFTLNMKYMRLNNLIVCLLLLGICQCETIKTVVREAQFIYCGAELFSRVRRPP